MSDTTTLGLAASAVGLVNSTISVLKEARDAAKRSSDHDQTVFRVFASCNIIAVFILKS
jgi:hypothetical protein